MIDPHTLPDDLPAPVDDGAAAHLPGHALPQVPLASTDGADVSLAELEAAGARVFGLSTQDTAYQRELVDRLALPFAILSDERLELTRALRLPTFDAAGQTLLKRLTILVRDGAVERVWYPVFPPDRHATEVLVWLAANPASR